MLIILMILFLDRSNNLMVIFTIFMLLALTFIAIARSIESRNEWRKINIDQEN